VEERISAPGRSLKLMPGFDWSQIIKELNLIKKSCARSESRSARSGSKHEQSLLFSLVGDGSHLA
jgi:hypothetical protein